MTLSTTTIPFSDIKFIDDVPRLSKIEERLTDALRKIRTSKKQRPDPDDMSLEHVVNWYDLIQDADTAMIKRRAMRFVERLHSGTGTHHLPERDRATLTALRGGVALARIKTEHEADEIAAALHTEMPWMSPATEVVWQGLRASARDGLPGLRFHPLILVGAPGIGKSHWARRLAHHLGVPTTMIEATGEPASFALVGSQRGWGAASPGKLIQTILRERHAGPVVIIDEVEKCGVVQSTQGSRYTLTDALLPLLERMSARTWECPYYQVKFDASWVNWVTTANSRKGLSDALVSRSIVLDMPDLTGTQMCGYIVAQGEQRGLPRPAIDAMTDAIEMTMRAGLMPSLRTANRMLDRAALLATRPVLQ
ncbi:ATPase family associated with various cellular activities (AAA) [Loktanella sp. DSM 29012]|uniref:AAA family ATPase n=1 Tax=Loktanella sp. DSM 29012 TaxID=1881056 RepID=UPI0008ABD560|nr:AAA family ATPase [Loktanella sp. DSM 29012]SEP66508.1 ATPase family associated with various cellular activities (AAA) [Loktanella sp. DSM 29012]